MLGNRTKTSIQKKEKALFYLDFENIILILVLYLVVRFTLRTFRKGHEYKLSLAIRNRIKRGNNYDGII